MRQDYLDGKERSQERDMRFYVEDVREVSNRDYLLIYVSKLSKDEAMTRNLIFNEIRDKMYLIDPNSYPEDQQDYNNDSRGRDNDLQGNVEDKFAEAQDDSFSEFIEHDGDLGDLANLFHEYVSAEHETLGYIVPKNDYEPGQVLRDLPKELVHESKLMSFLNEKEYLN